MSSKEKEKYLLLLERKLRSFYSNLLRDENILKDEEISVLDCDKIDYRIAELTDSG